MHSLSVGIVADIGESLYLLVLVKLRYRLDKTRLVHLIRQLGNDYLISAVLRFLNLAARSYGYLAASCRIRRTDSGSAHDNAGGREIGPLYVLHYVFKRAVGVIYHAANAVDNFLYVVRRNVRRHTDRDTRRTVYKEIGIACGQHGGFFKAVVVVALKIDRVFVYIGEHFCGNLAHSRLGIPVCSRRVAVYRTEVSVSVDKNVSHRERLCKTNHSVVNGSVAVGVIAAEHRADRVRALTVFAVRGKILFVHRVQYASVDGLQAVPYIGERTLHYDRHRIVEERFAHFFVKVNIYKLSLRLVRYIVVVFNFFGDFVYNFVFAVG